MNKQGSMTLKEMVGLVLFALVLSFVFFPLGSKAYAIFKGVSNEEKAESTLNEITNKVQIMVNNNVFSDSNIKMDSPLNWFLVVSEGKLCICEHLPSYQETQEENCAANGVCTDLNYDFEIDNPGEVDNSRTNNIGRGNGIKLEGNNFLVIEKDKSNFFIFKKSVSGATLDDVLNEFLDTEIVYSENDEKIGTINKNIAEKICSEKSGVLYGPLFEKQIELFFRERMEGETKKIESEGDILRIEIGSSLERLGSENQGLYIGDTYRPEFIYPRNYFPGDFSSGARDERFTKKLPTGKIILEEGCVVYLTSTTSDLSVKSGVSNE